MKFRDIGLILSAATLLLAPAMARADGPYSSKSQSPSSTAAEEPAGIGQGGPGKCAVQGERKGKGKRQAMKRQFKNLSKEDRARLKSIHAKLSDQPDVKAAREAMKNADSREARREAAANLREVSRKHMSAEDQAFMDSIKKKAGGGKKAKKCPVQDPG